MVEGGDLVTEFPPGREDLDISWNHFDSSKTKNI